MKSLLTSLPLPLLSLLLLALVPTPAAAASTGEEADALLGRWLTAPSEQGQAHIEVVREGEVYHGTIIWLEKPLYPPDDPDGLGGRPKNDRNNPDPALRSRPVLGLSIVDGFRYAGDGRWEGGTIYDPEVGKTYKCKVRLDEDGTLFVRGYVGISLLGRTTTWTRAQAAAATPAAPQPQP